MICKRFKVCPSCLCVYTRAQVFTHAVFGGGRAWQCPRRNCGDLVSLHEIPDLDVSGAVPVFRPRRA